ncbi:DUF5820 family protein [Halopenitus salinus]|jgi:hypothetical protein|uniref:DUF5820 family protein n=1 Tax=Halopenitus salinus TaxID=1198295 RepID=A0ABD5UXB7_9EURY
MSLPELPDGWRVWNEEPEGRVILVFRPDVFSGDALPAECLPTIYVTNGSRRRRPGAGQYRTGEWHVVLFLEPEIEALAETYGERETALESAADVARRFSDGAIDYRDPYQRPRERYFEELDRLVGE